jgi:SAM-dependent methyltransferase
VRAGSNALDVAAGAGEQSLVAARRVASSGFVLATDIASNLVAFAAEAARQAGLFNVETRVMDGEDLELEAETFDAVISHVGLIYFPDQQRALTGMRRVLKLGGKIAAIVYSTGENNKFFSRPSAIIRRRAQLPPPLPGQPGPFNLGSPGVLEEAFTRAGFRDVQTHVVAAPLEIIAAERWVAQLDEHNIVGRCRTKRLWARPSAAHERHRLAGARWRAGALCDDLLRRGHP